MEHEAVAGGPRWIIVMALVLCSLVTVGAFLIAVFGALLMARRKGGNHREVADLREENAQLRAEIEQLKKGPSVAGSTDIKP